MSVVEEQIGSAVKVADSLTIGDDPSAFVEAVRGDMRRLRRLAARLSPPGEAEDVVQEALVRAWRGRGTYNPTRGTFANWLLAIVANEARRTGRGRHPPVGTSASLAPPPIEQRLDVELAVRRLAPRQRLAVDCFYFVGLSVAETAAVMNCSEGTVKSTLADARARLKNELQGLPDEN